MKKYLLLLVLFFLLLILPGIIYAGSETDALLVKFESPKNINEISDKYGINEDKIEKVPEFDVYKIEKPTFIEKIKGEVEYAEPNYEYKASLVPNDVYYDRDQWNLPKISAPSGWDSTQGSQDIIIAIIDTGINGLHEDLFPKVISGYDYIHNIDIPANSNSDDHFHGTAVAGVASAMSNNYIGITGVSWRSRLMPVKALILLRQ